MTDIPVSKPVDFAASPFCAELAAKELAKSKAPPVEFAKLEFGAQAIPGMIGGPKGGPAVIVLQEWWGLTPQVLTHAAILAAAGFRVLVPDLYKGKIGVSAEEAHHLMGDLDFPGAVREIGQAAAHLKGEGAPAVGIIGFCMGGALSLGAAAKSADIACAVSCYGVNFDLFAPAELATKPVQGHYGAHDKMSGFSDLPTARKLQAVLREAGNEGVEVFEYNRSGHAFLNDDPSPFASFEQRQATMGTPPFDKEEAAAAWERILGFFRAHLGVGAP